MDRLPWSRFKSLRDSGLKTAKAWAMKEAAMCLWRYVSRAAARRIWREWIAWVLRSRLEPVNRIARLVRDLFERIVTAVVIKTHNASAEGINGVIQWPKRIAWGFRNRARFRRAIVFHPGGLDLQPRVEAVS
jgi:transposase